MSDQDGITEARCMAAHGLVRMARVEIVARGRDSASIQDILRSAGVTGWTALSQAGGFGHSGYHEARLLFNDHDSLSLTIAILPDERLDPVLAGLRALFEDRSGVFFVSDSFVSRPEYFA